MNDLADLDQELRSVSEEHGKFRYACRDIDGQRAAGEAFADLANRADAAREAAAMAENEDTASRFLSAQCACEAFAGELRMLVQLKLGDADAAWNLLVQAQRDVAAAVRAHPVGEQFEGLADELHAYERLLFPKQIFMSTGWLIMTSHCSICSSPYGECEHIGGRAYMGQFCARVITEAQPQEVSIVETPEDKQCRVLTIGEGGVTRDVLSWREVPADV